MKGITQKQIERGRELLTALEALFRPFVEAACRPTIEAEMRGPPPTFDEEAIDGLTEYLRNAAAAEGHDPDRAEAEIAKVRAEMRNPAPFSDDEIEEAVREESATACAQLVRNWINAYFYAEADENGCRMVSGKDIDDAMLPPLSFVLEHRLYDGQTGDQLFAECCNMQLDAAATRAVLRKVRATLPPGQVMPAEAIELLAQQDVAIVP